VLLQQNIGERNTVAFLEFGKDLFVVIPLFLVVHVLAVDAHEAREANGRAIGAEGVVVATGKVDCDLIDGCVNHLAGDGALPDQVVEFVLIFVQEFLEFIWRAFDRGRANALVCFLCIFGLVLVDVDALGQIVLAVTLGDQVTQFIQAILRESD